MELNPRTWLDSHNSLNWQSLPNYEPQRKVTEASCPFAIHCPLPSNGAINYPRNCVALWRCWRSRRNAFGRFWGQATGSYLSEPIQVSSFGLCTTEGRGRSAANLWCGHVSRRGVTRFEFDSRRRTNIVFAVFHVLHTLHSFSWKPSEGAEGRSYCWIKLDVPVKQRSPVT